MIIKRMEIIRRKLGAGQKKTTYLQYTGFISSKYIADTQLIQHLSLSRLKIRNNFVSVLDRAHLTARHKHPLNIVQVKIDFTSFSTNLTARITAGSQKNQTVL